MTKSLKISADVTALLKARNALLWIVTREESRVERYIAEICDAANYVPRFWDVAQGVTDLAGRVETQIGGASPDETLAAIRLRALGDPSTSRPPVKERGVWIMRDLPVWTQTNPGTASIQRALRNLARVLPGVPRDSFQAIIVLSPNGDVPPELAGHAVVIEWPLPDREEIADELDAVLEQNEKTITPQAREAAIDAAVGLSGEEAASCFSKSIVLFKTVDPIAVAQEKKRTVGRATGLEWIDPLQGGLDAVGGLDVLKDYLNERRCAFTPEARAYGLPAPKGCVLVGVQGCGKSLFAKATATAWNWPLLKADLGAQKSKYVGDSEANLRNTLKTIDAVGPCVVWLDEVEKMLQGATTGSADGGVAADQLGVILNWMQERTTEAYVIATSNNIDVLPPELTRKGRFDEIWFVDVPTPIEREAVLAATLRTYGRGNAKIDLAKVADKCNGFTGSEIASLVPEAMFAAFNDSKREITTADLLKVAATIVPLTQTYETKISALRNWAKGKARYASRQEADVKPIKGRVGRAVDLS